jgi:uncharacterized protein with ParB-like and HNH nuclease domain
MADMQTQLDELKRQVDFGSYDITVKELISLVADGTIDIAPEYQRHFRWDGSRQSQLIESIFLGIPIPSLFMATNKDATWELIDGVQRLSSIIHFAGGVDVRSKIGLPTLLKLEELEKLQTFNGKHFEELPKSIQLGFLMKPLKITTLSDKSDLSVRFDLFERLNTGGVSLSNQEIRSCVYRGKFNDFLKELALNADFKQVVRVTRKQETDATREELVLRFFAFLDNYQNFDHSVVDFLNEYMRKATKSFDYEAGRSIFEQTFASLAHLPSGITRNRTTTPVNLYEAVAVGAALALRQGETLNTTNTDWIVSDELKVLTSGATNSRSRVTGRIEFAKAKFLG